MFDNLIILFTLLPFAVLFLGGIFTLSIENTKRRFEIATFMIAFSLFLNSLLLIIPDFEIDKGSIQVTRGNLYLIEFVLIISLIFSISALHNLKTSKFIEYFGLIYSLLVSSFVGMSLSDNILIVVFFFMMSTVLVIQVFYFGDYEKDFFQIRSFLAVAVLSFTFLIIGVIILFINKGTFNMNEIKTVVNEELSILDVISLFLLIFGFGAIVGIAPIGFYHLNDYFEESNPVSLKIFNIVFIPAVGMAIFRIITCFTVNNSNVAFVLFLIGGSGLVVNIIWTMMELFGKFRRQSYSLKKILGYLGLSDFNLFLILISSSIYASSEFKIQTYTAALMFMIGSSITKAFIYEALNPIFDDPENEIFDLKLLGDYYRVYPNMFYIFVIGVSAMLFPYLPGNIFLANSLNYIFSGSTSPVHNGFLILSFIMVISYIIIFCFAYSIIASEIFFGKPKYRELSGYQKVDSFYLITPLLLIFGLVVLVFIQNFMTILFNSILNDLILTTF